MNSYIYDGQRKLLSSMNRYNVFIVYVLKHSISSTSSQSTYLIAAMHQAIGRVTIVALIQYATQQFSLAYYHLTLSHTADVGAIQHGSLLPIPPVLRTDFNQFYS